MVSPSTETIRDLLRRRLSRRAVLAGGSLLAVSSAARVSLAQSESVSARIEPSMEDRVIVPDGYDADVVLRWGDPMTPGATGLDMRRIADGALLERGAAQAQAGAFGENCDGMGVFDLGEDRLLVCINHEFVNAQQMFPGWIEARDQRALAEYVRKYPEAVAVMQAAMGVSVVELERRAGRWQSVADSRFNARITANTPMQFAGPAARHEWLGGSENGDVGRCLGTMYNCAAGTTPWGTYLTAEENVDQFFGNGAAADFGPALALAQQRFGYRRRDSVNRWEYVDARFNIAANPTELMKFGWVVEVDPFDGRRAIKKRTALGRFAHEGATTVLTGDGRPVVYMGDDAIFEYFYKFVADRRFDPDNPAGNRDLLDSGSLYVARLFDDGRGEWIPLTWDGHPELTAANGFESQADVVLRCREAADRVGATPLDRPEDVAVHPLTGKIYLSCTQNPDRGTEDDRPFIRLADRACDSANPRGPNPYGHILEFIEDGDDFAATRFNWNVFVLAGDPRSDGLRLEVPDALGEISEKTTYFGGQADASGLSAFSNPDNLGFDASGNLWIVTDGQQPNDSNNGCFVCPTEGPDRGAVHQFMSGPIGAEVSGCTFSPDGQSLFLTVQHPGSGGSTAAPISHWPDGGESLPRSSLVAISPTVEGRQFGS